jgi:ABC-type lipoprotein export system ATPase subunit
MNDYLRGSEWRKWDLQVQTIIDDGYISIGAYAAKLKKAEPVKWQELCNRIGSEELVEKYDSKAYFFTDTTANEKTRTQNYAKVFIAFLEIFNDHEEIVACITDHNYYNSYLIDALLRESQSSAVSLLPGVEINVGGVHMLVIFDKLAYGKTNYSETIKHFLSQIKVHNAKENGVLTVSSVAYSDVVNEIQECNALLIYAHCNSSNGLFQERGRLDRTHLAAQFNYQKLNILQSKTKKSADTTTSFIAAAPTLKSGHVFTLGSDARSLKDILQPDEDGNYCWIKADPTFDGLRQINYEPSARVFIGTEPKIIGTVKGGPTRFIERLKINQINGYDESKGVWFKDIDIPLNSEMVSIIGNKGSGKSAIADVLGLLGESRNIGAASFLSTSRFKKPGLAKQFEAEITWASGDSDKKNLFDDVDITSVEKIKYLPQSWFEGLTNDLDGKQFGEELEKVVYTHLDNTEKYGCESFRELINYKSQTVGDDMVILKRELHEINVDLVSYLKKTHKDYVKEITAELEQKTRELEAHIKLEPPKIENPDKDGDEKSGGIMQNIRDLDAKIEDFTTKIKTSIDEQVIIRTKIQDLRTFEDDISRIKRNAADLLSTEKVIDLFGDNTDEIIKVVIDDKKISNIRTSLAEDLSTKVNLCLTEQEIKDLNLDSRQEELLLNTSLKAQLDRTLGKRAVLKATLEKPQEHYQKFLEAHKIWTYKKILIEGDSGTPEKGTINYFKTELKNTTDLYPKLVETHKSQQKSKSQEIYAKKNEIVKIYSSIKSKVDAVIAANKPNIEDYSINIEASLTLGFDFRDDILDHLNLRAKGSFMVKEAGFALLSKIIDEKDPNNLNDFESIQESIDKNLEEDARPEIKEGEKKRSILDQVPNPVSFYDYLYGLDYLNENYQLKLDNKNLESLSPGEKGALLLVFYLMLDQDNIPLLIDQPEDNLDNQSVAKILVKFINGAKARRQIILVTHNPNLAIVADSEQVIYTHFNKSKNNTFSAYPGSIEDEETNKRIVDVLEGTMPAFDKRRLRYLKEMDK